MTIESLKSHVVSISELYGILFSVKEIQFVLEMIKIPMVIRNACIVTNHQNHVHVYFVNIACKSVIDNNFYTE